MTIIVSLLLGIIIGSTVTYYALQKKQQIKIIREYETQIRILKEQHQQALKEAENKGLDENHAVIKGRTAEQLSPVPPNFQDLPSDEQVYSRDYNLSEPVLIQKTYSIKEIQKMHPQAYKPWTKAEDEQLKQRYKQGMTINNLAREFQRQPGGIQSRLKKLELLQ